MPYTYEIEEIGDYIKAVISGEYVAGEELEDAVDIWGKVLNGCKGKGCDRILAIWSVPGYLPTMAAYNLADSGDRLGWPKEFKLAVVHTTEERYQDSLMAETFAGEHGFNVKMFMDENAARKWLMED